MACFYFSPEFERIFPEIRRNNPELVNFVFRDQYVDYMDVVRVSSGIPLGIPSLPLKTARNTGKQQLEYHSGKILILDPVLIRYEIF